MTELNKEDQEILDWCNRIAILVADAMIDAGLFKNESFSDAVSVASTEIMVRLAMSDYPPNRKTK